MPGSAGLTEHMADAREFAQSVAGVVRRHGSIAGGGWAPGQPAPTVSVDLTAALDEIGWETLSDDPALIACAGLGGIELGRGLAPLIHVDRLLSASPVAGDLVRCRAPEAMVFSGDRHAVTVAPVLRSVPCPSADGLDVHRVLETGPAVSRDSVRFAVARAAWRAAGVGYLAGLGESALQLTVEYACQRRAFGATLAALPPVQQLLAAAATWVRGVGLLAGDGPDNDALAYAGTAIVDACAACQQVSGAIGFTLEYPLHRYSQRARALATWNDALLGGVVGG
ncbi:MAG: acyl-CoA dehydrogenase family protein [Solirubrobacteraceae bacterium]